MSGRVVAWFVVLLLFSAPVMAGSAAEALEAAKTARAATLKAADAALVNAFDEQVKALAADGKMDELKAVLAQRDEFNKSKTLPSAPFLATAAETYRKSTKSENAKLAAAYDAAIREKNTEMKVEEAAELRSERDRLLAGEGGAVAPSGDAIYDRLQQAKADREKSVSSARQKLADTVETRLTAAADKGDLAKVKQLQAAKASLAAEGKINTDELKEPLITAAVRARDESIKAADRLLAKAYDDAVTAYTKARKIPDAEAVAAEKAKTFAAETPSASGGSTGGTAESIKLDRFSGRTLPAYLRSSDKATITKDGLTFSESEGTIRTKDGKYLEQDWIFDVVYEQIRTDERRNAVTRIGIGEGSFDGGYAEPQASANLRIEAPNGDGVIQWVKNGFGAPIKLDKVKDPGVHMVRLEKKGDALTISFCRDFNGTFTADVSHTIPNIRDYAPFLNKNNTYLFINGGGIFKGTRLVVMKK